MFLYLNIHEKLCVEAFRLVYNFFFSIFIFIFSFIFYFFFFSFSPNEKKWRGKVRLIIGKFPFFFVLFLIFQTMPLNSTVSRIYSFESQNYTVQSPLCSAVSTFLELYRAESPNSTVEPQNYTVQSLMSEIDPLHFTVDTQNYTMLSL